MAERLQETVNLIERLKNLSVRDFQNFGLHQIAYIRPKMEKDKKRYAICAADGKEILVVDSQSLAIVSSKQNELDPVCVH